MKRDFNSSGSKMIPTPDGTKRWYKDGLLHREDGPAYEGVDGTRHWYRRGKLHNEDGPAIINPDGSRQFWLDGQQSTEKEVMALHARRVKAEKERTAAE